MPDALDTSSKRAVAAIVEEQVGVGRQPLGTAVDRHPFPQAVRSLPRLGGRREIEPQVVGHEQIEPPVAIVVDERAARSPAHARLRQAGARR